MAAAETRTQDTTKPLAGREASMDGRLAVSDVANSEEEPAMTIARAKLSVTAEGPLKGDPDGPREAVRAVPREVQEVGMAGRHRRARRALVASLAGTGPGRISPPDSRG